MSKYFGTTCFQQWLMSKTWVLVKGTSGRRAKSDAHPEARRWTAPGVLSRAQGRTDLRGLGQVSWRNSIWILQNNSLGQGVSKCHASRYRQRQIRAQKGISIYSPHDLREKHMFRVLSICTMMYTTERGTRIGSPSLKHHMSQREVSGRSGIASLSTREKPTVHRFFSLCNTVYHIERSKATQEYADKFSVRT
jgi:hypothetical protein